MSAEISPRARRGSSERRDAEFFLEKDVREQDPYDGLRGGSGFAAEPCRRDHLLMQLFVRRSQNAGKVGLRHGFSLVFARRRFGRSDDTPCAAVRR